MIKGQRVDEWRTTHGLRIGESIEAGPVDLSTAKPQPQSFKAWRSNSPEEARPLRVPLFPALSSSMSAQLSLVASLFWQHIQCLSPDRIGIQGTIVQQRALPHHGNAADYAPVGRATRLENPEGRCLLQSTGVYPLVSVGGGFKTDMISCILSDYPARELVAS